MNDQITSRPQATGGKPLHDEISRRAQDLWEQYGRPDGRDEEIWLEAERQLIGANPAISEQREPAALFPPGGPAAQEKTRRTTSRSAGATTAITPISEDARPAAKPPRSQRSI